MEAYSNTIGDLCRCLLPIAQRMNAGSRLTIVYGTSNGEYHLHFIFNSFLILVSFLDRLPGSHQILARLITFAGVNGLKSQRASYVLQLMKEMAPFFFPNLRDLWSHEIVSLLNTLEGKIFLCRLSLLV